MAISGPRPNKKYTTKYFATIDVMLVLVLAAGCSIYFAASQSQTEAKWGNIS